MMCVYLGEHAVTKLSVLHVEEKTIDVSVRVIIMLDGHCFSCSEQFLNRCSFSNFPL